MKKTFFPTLESWLTKSALGYTTMPVLLQPLYTKEINSQLLRMTKKQTVPKTTMTVKDEQQMTTFFLLDFDLADVASLDLKKPFCSVGTPS